VRPRGKARTKQVGLHHSLLVLTAFFFFVLIEPARAQPDNSVYLQQLIERANTARLYEQRYWHLLLHYRSSLSGFESEVDEPGFFLASNGKIDPKAELEATLRQFFSAELVGRSRQSARCAFIARYHWLREVLAIEETRLPVQRCDRFEAWLAELNPASITLIFPSAYMNNPSSMFGHLLFRIDQKGQTEQTRILAYTINYAADVTTDNGILFAVLGVTGGFKGYFSTLPYYMKAKEYGDFENRDIWEYRLNLTEEQLKRLLMHSWEMGNASFDYFFFKENCAYHILSLLDVAAPELHLTEQFSLFTFPSDAVRLIAEKPYLVKEVRFRSSRSTKIRRGREGLSRDERRFLSRIVKDPTLAQTEEFMSLPPKRQAAVLDVASDYLLYQSVVYEDKAGIYHERNKSLLLARSRLNVEPAPVEIMPFSGPPEQGHDIRRAGFASGARNGDFFTEVNFRFLFHDLMDPEYGFTPDAQIEALEAAFRHYPKLNHTRLERFKIVDIVSLSPVDSLFKRPSWKVSTGLETIDYNGCRFCRIGNLQGGIGLAVESAFLKREVYFGFADVAAEYGRVFEQNHRIGGGATVGGLADITDRWKLSVSASYINFPLGDKSHDWRITTQQRFTLQKNVALRFEFKQRNRTQEYLFGIHAYF